MTSGGGQGRLPVIGVMGSGTAAHAARARELGRWIALHGAHLLTGGGGGIMAAASEAFCGAAPRRGLCIAVLPSIDENDPRAPTGYPNPWVEIAIRTHLHQRGAEGAEPSSRNHLNVLSSDALVFLPGGPGTASEARLAIRYGARAIAWCETAAEQQSMPVGITLATTFDEVVHELAAAIAALERR